MFILCHHKYVQYILWTFLSLCRFWRGPRLCCVSLRRRLESSIKSPTLGKKSIDDNQPQACSFISWIWTLNLKVNFFFFFYWSPNNVWGPARIFFFLSFLAFSVFRGLNMFKNLLNFAHLSEPAKNLIFERIQTF